jgi:hypothetical protein
LPDNYKRRSLGKWANAGTVSHPPRRLASDVTLGEN